MTDSKKLIVQSIVVLALAVVATVTKARPAAAARDLCTGYICVPSGTCGDYESECLGCSYNNPVCEGGTGANGCLGNEDKFYCGFNS